MLELAGTATAFFHASQGRRPGQRLYLYQPPALADEVRGAVLYVHPFAEEMNKARRMAALQARRLAAAGYAVLQPDIAGCGDSSGDFGDATWNDWITDIVEAASWLRKRHPAPLWLWGLRAGALLACAAAPQLPTRAGFVFWQPVLSGRHALQQFLRLRAAGEMLEGGAKGVVANLRQQLAAGQAVDVAGYRIHPAMAEGLDAATLEPPRGVENCRVEWLELQSQPGATLSIPAARAAEAWAHAGARVRTHTTVGPAFWQTTEIEDAPLLIDATIAALDAQPPGPVPSDAMPVGVAAGSHAAS